MLRFSVLGSGSSGNSAVVCRGGDRVLIDAGLSARQLQERLASLGIDPDSIRAVVLTHEHGDHVRGLDVFCRKRPLPVYATRDTCAVAGEGLRSAVRWMKFEAGQSFEIGGIRFDSFTVPHDAVDPVGYVARDLESGAAVGILSDLGQPTGLIRERLRDVDTLFIEANYDEALLVNDTKRPWATKQRISSRHGHLSNDQAAELVASAAGERLHRVVLGHLSLDCNTPEAAIQAVSRELAKAGRTGVAVECALPREPLPLREAAAWRPEEPPGPSPALREDEARPPRRRPAPRPAPQQAEWVF